MEAEVKQARGLIAAAFAFAIAFVQLAEAATLGGVKLPSSMSVSGRTLELVSCGVRDTLWIDHYVVGLYISRGSTVDVVRDPARPKAVLIHMVETRYLPEHIPEKWLEALQRSLAPGPLSRLRRAYRRLSDGDVMTIVYVPAKGVTIRVNGKMVTQVAQHTVIDAILAAWAQDEPLSDKLHRLAREHPC